MNQVCNRYPGLLVVLEGIDGSGKSTLAKHLANYFTSQGEVVLTKEPGGSALGKELRPVLQHYALTPYTEFLLFAADRAQHIEETVKPALERGALVISDRMADSSYAYQGYGRGLDLNFILTVNSKVMADIVPDIIFFLSIDCEKALQRIHARNEAITVFEQQRLDFYERVQRGFEDRFKDMPQVIKLDGHKSQDELASQAITYLKARLR